MRFSRRQFMRNMLALPLAPLAFHVLDRAASPSALNAPSSIRSARWVQTAANFRAEQRANIAIVAGDSGLSLGGNVQIGTYLSSSFRADFPFNALAVNWQADVPEGTSLVISVRASENGSDWSNWLAARETGHLIRQEVKQIGDLITIRGLYIQWQARFLSSPATTSALLREVAVIYIDSSTGPRTADSDLSPAVPAETAGVVAPIITSRAGWGCPESYSSANWPPEYRRIEKTIVHHTATSNDYWDGAEIVRATWQYHAIELGWGDIGYNYLVDRFGYIYEGRFGGDDVIAGHALCYNPGSSGIAVIGNFENDGVSLAAQDSLVRLMAWIAYRRDRHPLGDSYFVDRVIGNICGHRDLNHNGNNYDGNSCHMATACPGANLYNQLYFILPTLRERTWNAFPKYADSWLSHDTPASLGQGETLEVGISVVNKGRLTWNAGGVNPVRLGYHWYRSDGSQYVQDPGEDRRTFLPGDIVYGQRADMRALLTSPRASGTYTLKWDMVQEGITWFEWQGAPILNPSVAVLPPALSVSQAALYFLADPFTNPSPQTIGIHNTGRGTLAWTASVDRNWCRLNATSGQAPDTVTVSIDKSVVAAGATYSATIIINSEGATDSPQLINLSFKYSDRPLSKIFLPLTSRSAAP